MILECEFFPLWAAVIHVRMPAVRSDFAILDRDYLSIPDEEIRDIQATLTAVDGRVVHGSGKFASLAPELPALEPDWSPVNEFGGFYRPS